MIIIPISLLTGVAVAITAYLLMQYLASLRLEKRLKEKKDTVGGDKRKGITGNLLFVAEKIGMYAERSKNKHCANLAEKARANLEIAGAPFDTITPYTFLGIQFLAGLGAVIIAVLVLDMYNLILLLGVGVLGFFVPPGLLQTKVKEKHKAIFRQIPDVLDLLSLMIEAGLDFNSALNRVLDHEDGPLIKEFHQAQQEVKLGKSRADAFTAMAERLRYQPLTTVVNSLNLSFKTGVSIAPTLKTLSEQFRVERSQLAEKMAGEAPLKLMLPLVLLIFPTIFIILFGPILLTFMGGGMW